MDREYNCLEGSLTSILHFNKTTAESGLPSGAYEFPPLEPALSPVKIQLVALGTVMPLLAYLVHLAQHFVTTAHRAHKQAGMSVTILILQHVSYLWALQKPVTTKGISFLSVLPPKFAVSHCLSDRH